MKGKKFFIPLFLVGIALLIGCSSQEFTSAKLYVQQNNLPKAEEFFLLAMEREPMNPEIPYLLARDVYGPQEKYGEALKYLNKSLELGPNFKEEIEQLKEYYWQKSYNEGLKYYTALQNKTVADSAQAVEEAIRLLTYAKEFNPDDERAYYQLARITKTYKKDDERSMAYIDEGIENVKEAPLLKEYKAIQLIQKGKKDQALVLLKEVMQMDTDRKQDATRLYAQVLLEEHRYDEAEETFKKILEENPENPDNYFNLGYLYVRMATEAKENGDNDLAEQLFEKAKNQFETVLAMNPDDMLVIEAVGDLYAELKDYATAEYYYQQLVNKDLLNANYLKKLGRVIYLQGRHEEGQAIWDQAKVIESLE
ncbi:MAG: tetratricopeptide repeat protein [Candidatus Marinimicrobia bacterium]|nr:tetratricopeptide repeat protein [Candidatus Neomarinimicrobiota bacterium]MDD5582245.1 tetratricopeptide repeat protein [Candidatus Neomarinimicrobiota bacterium]